MARRAMCLIALVVLAWRPAQAVAAGDARAVVRLGGRRALQQGTWSGFPAPHSAAAATAYASASNAPQQAAVVVNTAASQLGTSAGAIAIATPLFAQQLGSPGAAYQQQQPLVMQQPAMQQPATQQPAMQHPVAPHVVNLPIQLQQGQQRGGEWTGASANGAPSSASAGSSDANMPAILDLHNSLRAKHSASPLAWSPELASAAQAWADRCVFQHSGGGENLAQYFPDPISAVQAWYDEIRMYDYASASYSSATGHATQLLWRASTQLGCGWTAGCQLLVCRYSPPGNVLGQFAQNVMPPAA